MYYNANNIQGTGRKIIRAKVLVQTDKGPFRFGLSYEETLITPFDRSITKNRLVVTGENLDSALIEKVIRT
ncbi:MAG TPA: hypothetical protein ENH38_00430 [Nitrospirae bacterium]|nr:hypothetical protein [Nitrospirota bacterium]